MICPYMENMSVFLKGDGFVKSIDLTEKRPIELINYIFSSFLALTHHEFSRKSEFSNLFEQHL